MKCQLLLLLGVFINISAHKENFNSIESETFIEGYLLCKSCGEDTAVLNLVDNSVISDINLGLSNITIGSKEILIQNLKNPRGINFKVLISKKASCARASGWFSDSTWFEGFAWKVCQCPVCKAHIGWMFEPIELAAYNPLFPSNEGFYAIILDAVISEAYVDSLLIVDRIIRN